jgi:NAD(P)-dependent dehydrogenase (short-subunit alcohol dehydrogenase family)
LAHDFFEVSMSNNPFSIKDKNVVITGGVSGIGLETAKRFVESGANVVVCDLKDDNNIAADIGAHFYACDVTQEQAVADALEFAQQKLGKLHTVINNAGVGGVGAGLEETDMEAFRSTYDVNVMGVVHGLKYAARHMNDGGAIINTASMAGFWAIPGDPAYHSSKAAVISLTANAAMELGPRNICVTAVCPTFVKTPMITDAGEDAVLDIAAIVSPLGAIPTVEDLAGIFHFLASREARFLTGSAITVDGGSMKGFSYQTLEKLMS